jgi:hypothetical protein
MVMKWPTCPMPPEDAALFRWGFIELLRRQGADKSCLKFLELYILGELESPTATHDPKRLTPAERVELDAIYIRRSHLIIQAMN